MVIGVVLAAFVAGCGRAPQYDARLVAADSLLRDDPDSALAVVDTLCRDSLATEGDRAYRDLLLTQARYRAYQPATSDSGINRALAYYRARLSGWRPDPGEREKLTRAHLYKGAVMEELGHPDSAMLHYKQAEAVADTADHFNLGYCNLRIADLYMDEVTDNKATINRLHMAVSYFKSLRDTTLLISALGKLGSVLGYSKPDSAKQYLWRAIRLAQQFDSTLQYTQQSTLAGVYLFQEEYDKANALAMNVLRHGREYSFETQFYFYAAMSYIKLGKLDSARYVMSITPAPQDEVDSLALHDLSAELSIAQSNLESYIKNISRSKEIVSEVLYSSREGELAKIESETDHVLDNLRFHTINHRNLIVLFITLTLLLFLSLITYWMWRRVKAYQKEKTALIRQLEQLMASMEARQEQLEHPRDHHAHPEKKETNEVSEDNETAKLPEDQETRAIQCCQNQPGELESNDRPKDFNINDVIDWRLSALRELFQSVKIRVNDENKARQVVSLSSYIKILRERQSLLDMKLKDTFWDNMRKSVDGEYNGIVTYIEKHYPHLNKRDIRFFCLQCAKIPPQLIMLCMNVTNVKTVTNYRSLLIKKMGHDLSFDDFIDSYMAGNIKD